MEVLVCSRYPGQDQDLAACQRLRRDGVDRRGHGDRTKQKECLIPEKLFKGYGETRIPIYFFTAL